MYAPPAYPPAYPPGPPGPPGPAGLAGALTRDEARSKLIVPGIALACISGLLIAVFLLDLILFASGMPLGTTTATGVPPDMAEWVRPFTIAVCIFAALANAFNVFAAIQMVRVRTWGLALAGCIVAAIPLTSSACCILTLPFSIWAIVMLVKPEIRAAFKQDAP